MTDSDPDRAAFARGFFLFLEARGIHSVVLHGGEAGFEGITSDIDFAVSRDAFMGLEDQVHAYCRMSGWRLCQILRHEATAAYFICSASHDAGKVVALDACSDYQRHRAMYLSAGELLENRRLLSWGGHGLSPEWELLYRFAKAAAKSKDPEDAAAEFSGYSPEARQACAHWLDTRWNIKGVDWTREGLDSAFGRLLREAARRRHRFDLATLRRFLGRLLRPTGLIVEHEGKLQENELTTFAETAGRLYFRRHRMITCWKTRFLRDLVSSTLILVPKLPLFWRWMLPANCRLSFPTTCQPNALLESLAGFLQERCNPTRKTP